MDQSPISSPQNPRFRLWKSYLESPQDPECPWIGVEGRKQILELCRGHRIELLIHAEKASVSPILAEQTPPAISLRPALFSRLSALSSPPDAIAFFSKPAWTWKDLSPWLLYLEGIQDPGNLGTLLRSARATGMFSLVTAPDTVSFFNSKVVRASTGALFQVPFLEAVPLTAVKERGFRVIAASTSAREDLFGQSFSPPTAFLLGNEGHGVSPGALRLCEGALRLPMEPGSESLNVGVVGSLIMYHVYLQK